MSISKYHEYPQEWNINTDSLTVFYMLRQRLCNSCVHHLLLAIRSGILLPAVARINNKMHDDKILTVLREKHS